MNLSHLTSIILALFLPALGDPELKDIEQHLESDFNDLKPIVADVLSIIKEIKDNPKIMTELTGLLAKLHEFV